MTDTNTGFNEGSVFFVVNFPRPWPPKTPLPLRQNLSGGRLLVEIGINEGRIQASILSINSIGQEYILITAASCPIDPNGHPTGMVGIEWRLPSFMRIHANGHLLYSSDATEIALSSYKIETIGLLPNTQSRFDFTAKNARALSRRHGRLSNIARKPGTEFGGAAYQLESLKDELDQLRSLTASVKRGETFHAKGISARLRLLLLRTGQYPLLQSAAVTKNMPLIAYTAANPDLKFPFSKEDMVRLGLVHLVLNSISGEAKDNLTNPIDIDVWLGQTGARISGNELSNEQVISDLGNTIGSHLDVNILPTVITLRATSTDVGTVPVDGVLQYLMGLAETVIALGEKVLETP